ncbi:class I adenylate-forming enzyme family protein [Aurantiacibacter poecillastricola]|uniref:class I adenylate-forming enzyme family protein n=1 Tax=Aurantiacibacter poecillastricola TaxID=3064385 RepID=UPI00273E5972|nr:class I adenylate-forming enzyme family protein [Aurantiacibacter sp. 219JJ12-13]MDP5261331.1 class I adenylate-forming enzyme family protein [Aurantiacibacter sp. 219JJ12-13]
MPTIKSRTQKQSGGPWSPPENWPAKTRAEVRQMLTAPGQPFEMEEVEIGGRPTRVWKNAPASLRNIALAGRTHGDALCTIYEEERVTYDAWFRAVAALAHHLRDKGVTTGDRVALAMRNLPEWSVAFFAITSLGAICVPLNAWWTSEELAFGLSDSGSKAVICDAERWERVAPGCASLDALQTCIVSRADSVPDNAERLEDIIGASDAWADLPERDLPEALVLPDDNATIFYTSGTTGAPKGALGSHRSVCSNVLSSKYNLAFAPLRRGEMPPEPERKTVLLVIPLFHVTACSAAMVGYIVSGHTMVFMHHWDPEEAFGIIEREKVNLTGGVPTIAWQLLDHPARKDYDLSSLELVTYGGAPAAPELVRRIREQFGCEPGSGWGMTETMATVTGHVAEDYLNRPDSCGPPVAVADLKIMSADGSSELPVGEVGELYARGPMIAKGYWNRPEETAQTFVDGWVRTGDLARLDEEGFCYIVDRAKDIVIRGGENIYSSEVENVLYEHPAVTDAAVIGLPHRQLGEEPAAVVHLASGESASEEELREWVGERLAHFKVPVRIVFTDAMLPRNANGKILKTDLRELF